MKRICFLLFFVFIGMTTQAQLIINEASQGSTGAREFVELLVTGNPVCGGSNTVDLRGWIFDDNNSWHGTGSGAGIAGGHVRFPNIAQWASVKIGTLILIYNEADVSPAIVSLGVDTNDANGDCVYVIPASSSVLEKNITLPVSSGTMTSYAIGSPTYSTTGTWVVLGMANSDDAFHTVSPADYANPYHAIGWNNDSLRLNIYFNAPQGNKVIFMANTVDNNPFSQANYKDTVSTLETPGAPNNAANAAWIHSLNNYCQPLVPPTITVNSPAPLTCSVASVVLTASSVTSGLNYAWSNSVNGANDTVSAAGVYYVTATTAGNICSAVDSVTVTSQSTLSVSVSAVNTTCGNSNGSAIVTITNGTANNYSWSNGGTTNSISGLAAGTYHVTVSASGGCSAIDSATIGPSSLNPVTITSLNDTLCSGDSTQICAPSGYVSYLWSLGGTTACIYAKQAGNYYVTVTDQNNCTATSNHLPIQFYPLPPVSISVNGDSLTSGNALSYQWYLNGNVIPNATSKLYVATVSGNYSVEVSDANGCHVTSNQTTVTLTGIEKLSSDELFSVAPNPLSFGNWQLIAGNDFIGEWAEIFDAEGRLIFKTIIASPKTEINVAMAKGIYLLKINSLTKKLIRL